MLKEAYGAAPATEKRNQIWLWMALAAVAAIIAVFALRPGPMFEEAGAEGDSAIEGLEKRGYPGP